MDGTLPFCQTAAKVCASVANCLLYHLVISGKRHRKLHSHSIVTCFLRNFPTLINTFLERCLVAFLNSFVGCIKVELQIVNKFLSTYKHIHFGPTCFSPCQTKSGTRYEYNSHSVIISHR